MSVSRERPEARPPRRRSKNKETTPKGSQNMTHWFSRDLKTGQEIQPNFAAFWTPQSKIPLPSF